MITFLDQADIRSKRVLLRVDYNVGFNPDGTVRDQTRILESLPTLSLLLSNKNKVIIVSHLGRPKGKDETLSLRPVVNVLQSHFKNYNVIFVPDFLNDSLAISKQQQSEIIFLENIRFYTGEQKNDLTFSKSLADLSDVYVNDAFSVDHRPDASIVGVAKLLPSYGGLLLKEEIDALQKILHEPKMPFVAILGGAKISSKLKLINKLVPHVSLLLVAGGLGNTLLLAKDIRIGKSIAEPDMLTNAKEILSVAKDKLLLPIDAVVGRSLQDTHPTSKLIEDIADEEMILDIGPRTKALFAKEIEKANTLIWNGPMGYFENQLYKKGSDAVCTAITNNDHVTAIVGGGETLAAIAQNPHLDKIYHISTGGGAMLEYLENSTLPGIEVLDR